jgi:hypothetical protein
MKRHGTDVTEPAGQHTVRLQIETPATLHAIGASYLGTPIR